MTTSAHPRVKLRSLKAELQQAVAADGRAGEITTDPC